MRQGKFLPLSAGADRDREWDDAFVYRPAIAGLCYNHQTYEQKITFGEMRASGVREILIYCRDHRCSHSVATNADGWPDDRPAL